MPKGTFHKLYYTHMGGQKKEKCAKLQIKIMFHKKEYKNLSSIVVYKYIVYKYTEHINIFLEYCMSLNK